MVCTDINWLAAMEPERERPWRRNAPNELIVNSILAAVSTIVVQTMVTSEHKYGFGWLLAAVASIVLFVISTERLNESIREDEVSSYIRSLNLYNFGVLLLFVSLSTIVNRYANLAIPWWILFLISLFLWAPFWGCDAAFLIFKGEQFDRWKRKMEGDVVEEQILDHCDIVRTRITRWRQRYRR